MSRRTGEVDERHAVVYVYRTGGRSQIDIRPELHFCICVRDRQVGRRKHVTGKVYVVRLVDQDGGVRGGHRAVEVERVVRTRAIDGNLTCRQVAHTQCPAATVRVGVYIEQHRSEIVERDIGGREIISGTDSQLDHVGAIRNRRKFDVRTGIDFVRAGARKVNERHVVVHVDRAGRGPDVHVRAEYHSRIDVLNGHVSRRGDEVVDIHHIKITDEERSTTRSGLYRVPGIQSVVRALTIYFNR